MICGQLSGRRTVAALNGLIHRADEIDEDETIVDFIAAEVSYTETQEAVSIAIGEYTYGLSARPDEHGYMTGLRTVGDSLPTGRWAARKLRQARNGLSGAITRAAHRAACERAAHEAQDEYDGMGWGHD